jgi:hypothetical protein
MATKINQDLFGEHLYSPQDLSKLKVFDIKNLRNDRILDWNKMNAYLEEFDFYKIQLEALEYYA